MLEESVIVQREEMRSAEIAIAGNKLGQKCQMRENFRGRGRRIRHVRQDECAFRENRVADPLHRPFKICGARTCDAVPGDARNR